MSRALIEYCRSKGYPVPEPEYEFALPERFWRFDLAFVEQLIALEIEGGIWTQGRHTRGRGFIRDLAKYNHATILGWRIARVTPEQIDNGEAFALLDRLFGNNGGATDG